MRILLLVAILLVPQTLWAQTDKCPDEYKPCVIGSSTLRTRTPGPPTLVGEDGTYLGRLSSNPYDPESTSNPFGRFGSPYSPHSINNPYGKYGSLIVRTRRRIRTRQVPRKSLTHTSAGPPRIRTPPTAPPTRMAAMGVASVPPVSRTRTVFTGAHSALIQSRNPYATTTPQP